MTAKLIGQYTIKDGLLVNQENGLALKLGKRANPTPTKPPFYLTTLNGGYISSLYPNDLGEAENGLKRYLLDYDGERLIGEVNTGTQSFTIQPRPNPRGKGNLPKSISSNIVMDFVSKFDTIYPSQDQSADAPSRANRQRIRRSYRQDDLISTR
jgi:hypothetical protein